MALPGVENVPTSQETVLKLSRAPQRPYIEKTKKYKKRFEIINFSLFPHRGTTPFGTTPFYHPLTKVTKVTKLQ